MRIFNPAIFILLLSALLFSPAYAGEPIQVSKELASIQKTAAEGNYETALAELSIYLFVRTGAPDTGRAFSLLGMCLLQSGKPEQAAEAFAVAEKHDEPIADAAAAYRIRALVDAGLHEQALEAIELFNEKHRGSPFCTDCDQLVAEALAASEKYEQAAAGFVKLAGSGPGAGDYSRFRLEASRAWIKSGQASKAKKTLRALLLTAPTGRYTVEALELFTELSDGRYPSALHELALEWYDEELYRPAAIVLKDLVRVQEAGGASSDLVHGLKRKLAYALFRTHANEEALELYREISAEKSAPDRPHSLYRIAKVLTRMGDNEASQKVFQQVLDEHPGSGYSPASRYQIALIDMEDNRYKKAYKYFGWRITKSGGNQEYLYWLAAWTALRSGKLTAAAKHLDDTIKRFKRSRDMDRYRFWRARIHATKKETAKAIGIYTSLNRAAPMSYYGIKAAEELSKHKKQSRSIASVFAAKGNGPKPPELRASMLEPDDRPRLARARILADLGMSEEAIRDIGVLMSFYEEEDDVRYGLAGLLQRAGAYSTAKRAAQDGMYRFCKNYSAPVGQTYYALKYPRGFPQFVEPNSKLRKLPPDLVYGLILAESGYRPQVVSPAAAIGLMQIIPRTGLEIATDLGEENYRESDLYNPALNVRFGVYYLSKVLGKFEGRIPLAIASYNAGPMVVSKWARNKGKLPDEIFIEEIPYRETNNYVKKVSTYRAIYKALYGL
jgi:peptidoglycan lytic transglycosylase